MRLHDVATSQLLLIVGCWAVVAYRVRHARRHRRDRPARALTVTIAALAAGTSIQLVAATLDQAVGVPNTGRLASNCATLVACGAAQAFVVHLWHPAAEAAPLTRRVWSHFGVVLPVVVLLFLVTPADTASSRADPRHAMAVYSSPYVYVYLSYLAYSLVRMLREVRRCLRLVTDAALRVTLGLAVAGCVAALAHVSFKVLYLVGHDLGVRPPGHEVSTATPMYILSIGLFTLCAAVPAGRAAFTGLRRRIRQYRSYQRLHPLWLAVYRATPAVALDPRPSRLRNRLTVRDLDFLLYRRVIEIRDGQLALRDQTPGAGDGGDRTVDDRHETEQLLDAMGRRADGQSAPDPGGPGPAFGSADLSAEIRSLERLAEAFVARRPADRDRR